MMMPCSQHPVLLDKTLGPCAYATPPAPPFRTSVLLNSHIRLHIKPTSCLNIAIHTRLSDSPISRRVSRTRILCRWSATLLRPCKEVLGRRQGARQLYYVVDGKTAIDFNVRADRC